MKQTYYLIFCILVLLPKLVLSISDLSFPGETPSEDTLQILSSTPCGTVQSNVLWAGQYINAGTVSVSNDANNLYIVYSTTGSWRLKKVHLYVGPCNAIPTNNGGNPTIGLFPYSQQFNPLSTTYTFTIPLGSVSNQCFCIAAHAELVKIGKKGKVIQSETGWAGNALIGGSSWARKFNYCLQECPDSCDVSLEVGNTIPSVCSEGSGSVILTPTGGVAPYSFTIVNTTTGTIYSNTSGIFNNIESGDYLAFVHDHNQCQPECQNVSFSIELLPSSISHTVDITGACSPQGSSLTLNATGSTGPFLYSIGGAFGPANQFVNLNPGTYNTTVLDANGCSSTVTVSVLSVSAPVLSTQNVQHATCSQQNGSILLTASAGTPAYTFVLTNLFTNQEWSNSTGYFTNLPSGSYSAYVVDANGCKSQHNCSLINVKNLLKNCHQNHVCKSENENSLIVYPNPAWRKAALYVEQELSSDVVLTITDHNGRVVYHHSNVSLRTEYEMDISELTPGMYFVDVYDEINDQHLRTRLVVTAD